MVTPLQLFCEFRVSPGGGGPPVGEGGTEEELDKEVTRVVYVFWQIRFVKVLAKLPYVLLHVCSNLEEKQLT